MQFVRNALAALALFGGASASFAAPTGPYYMDAVVGMSSFNIDCNGTSSCDDTDMGFRLGGGYKFDDTFGVTAGYLNFGKASSHTNVTLQTAAGRFNGAVDLSLKSSGPYIAGTLTMPLMSQLNFTGSLGGYYGMNKSSGTTCISNRCTNSSDKQNKIKPYVGLGLHYEVMKGLAIGGSVDVSQVDDGDDSNGVALIGASVRYSF